MRQVSIGSESFYLHGQDLGVEEDVPGDTGTTHWDSGGREVGLGVLQTSEDCGYRCG